MTAVTRGDTPAASRFVRLATENDLDAMVEIADGDPFATWGRDAFARELELAWSHVEILEQGADQIGFLVYWVSAGEVQLMNMATHPAHRCSGVASRLVAHLIARATELGWERIDLEVRQSNVAATRLYEAAGFSIVGRRTGYYQDSGEDAVLMTWKSGQAA